MCSLIEKEIVNSCSPLQLNETEEKTVLGETGIWLNKCEEKNWCGPLPITNYTINHDPNPEYILKTIHKPLLYNQNIWIKFLRPPKPLNHGDLIIRQENELVRHPAPPIIIRQLTERPTTPETLIYRERPPKRPELLPEQVITIPGRVFEARPRRVVIERMAQLPPKPQSIIIEKWLPYEKPKRRVVFEKTTTKQCKPCEPVRNLIIQWEMPNVNIEKETKCLGIECADPDEYIRKYGCSLKDSNDLKEYDCPVDDCRRTEERGGELEGDLHALSLLDVHMLENLGLANYANCGKNNRSTLISCACATNCITCYCSRTVHNSTDLKTITLRKDARTNEYGLVIRGGRDLNMPLFVFRVEDDGPAFLERTIKPGDEIVEINGHLTSLMKLNEAVDSFKTRDSVTLLIRQTGSPAPTIPVSILDALRNGYKV